MTYYQHLDEAVVQKLEDITVEVCVSLGEEYT